MDSVMPENLILMPTLYMINITKRDKQFEDKDPYNFQTWFTFILGSWLTFATNFEKAGRALVSRKGVENVIELAFRPRNQTWL